MVYGVHHKSGRSYQLDVPYTSANSNSSRSDDNNNENKSIIQGLLQEKDLGVWDRQSMWHRRVLQQNNALKGTIFVMDCGGGGDCLFKSIAAGYNRLPVDLRQEIGLLPTQKVTFKDVRHTVASHVTAENIELINVIYRTQQQEPSVWKQSFVKLWYNNSNPNNSNSNIDIDTMRKIITTSGTLYEGDDVALSLLSKHPKIGYLVLDSRGKIYCFQDAHIHEYYMLIHVINPGHYQLAAWVDHITHTIQNVIHCKHFPPFLIDTVQKDCPGHPLVKFIT